MAGPGAQAVAEGAQDDTAAIRAELVSSREYRHGSTLGHLWGDVDTERWADTLRPLQLTTVAAMVPGFSGSTETDLPITFTYDLEIGSTRYFASLDAGEVPLLLLFSGTVFTVTGGRIQVQQVPWSKEAAYRLPVTVWREAIDAHFPNSAWIKMSNETLADLHRFKTKHALPTWDRTLQALLAAAETAPDSGQPSNGRPGANADAAEQQP